MSRILSKRNLQLLAFLATGMTLTQAANEIGVSASRAYDIKRKGVTALKKVIKDNK